MIQAIVIGAPGRMGQRLIALMHTDSGLELVGAVAHAAHPALGRDVGELAGVGSIGVRLEHNLSRILAQADVVIDFSVAEATIGYMRLVAASRKAMVVGTTGFTEPQQEEIAHLSTAMPCLLAPNMSLGVNVLFQVLRQAASLLGPDYDVEIVEAHHRTKVDAPSGTALRLAAIIAETQGRDLNDTAIYGRQGMVGRRSDTEIGIQAIRAGDIVGEHTVLFGGIGERLEFVHRTQSRDHFARGALRAATWIIQQPPGAYTMEDLLRLGSHGNTVEPQG
ncbi:4-hydroxy-tetrahydrodipicolinate reductase [Candidatus Entotheonellaceae bacterium PAL068K]